MGVFGFFLFLSVVVIATTARSIQLAKIRQDTLVRIIESGRPVSVELLELLSANPPQLMRWVKLKIGILIVMGLGSVALSIAYWEAGTLPVMMTGLFGLIIAFATWSKAAREQRPGRSPVAEKRSAPGTSGNDDG